LGLFALKTIGALLGALLGHGSGASTAYSESRISSEAYHALSIHKQTNIVAEIIQFLE
jgi:hypothetical protein